MTRGPETGTETDAVDLLIHQHKECSPNAIIGASGFRVEVPGPVDRSRWYDVREVRVP